MTIKLYRFRERLFDGIATYGADNRSLIDRICAFLLALSPILQHYKGLYRSAGFTVLLFVVPVMTVRFLTRMRNGKYDRRCMAAVIPLLLFQGFKMFDHNVSVNKTIYGLFMMLLFLVIASGSVNMKYFIRYATMISCFASMMLVVQYICFYLLGFHLQLVPTDLLLRSSYGWILGAQTGMYGIRGLRNTFYRPSAFFLEPSHHFLYTFPILCILLFSNESQPWQRRYAVLVTIGMLLSTSGMGAAVAIALWVVFFTLYNSKNREKNIARVKNLFSARNIVILLVILAVLISLYFAVPTFQSTVNRFLVRGSSGQSTAVSGRVRLAQLLVRGMSGRRLILGVTEDVDEINFNLSGFYATLYKYGLIGIVFSYWYYVQFLFRVKGFGFWLTAVVLVTSIFSAHTHGTFYMMYYVIMQMCACQLAGSENKSLQPMQSTIGNEG